MKCPECGAKNSEESLFCEECGARLEHEEEKPREVVVKTKTKPKLKKPIIIGIVVLVIALGVGLYFGKDYIFKEGSLDVDWGNTYYLYLKENISNDTLEEIGLSKDISSSKINFIEVDDIEDPVMAITYERDESDYTAFYYIEEGSVVSPTCSRGGDIVPLYEIETETYNYYLRLETETSSTYNLVDDDVMGCDAENLSNDLKDAYTFTDEDKTTVSSGDEEITLAKFDETFIEIDVDVESELDLNGDIKEIKEVIDTASSSYQPLDEIVTDEVKTTVEEKITELEETKEKIKEIEEENKEERMEITSSNLQSKLGTQLKWFIAAYQGAYDGWNDIYDYVEITDTSQIKTVCGNEYNMLYKVSGLSNVSYLETKLKDYVLSSKISEFHFKTFTEYNDKVYVCYSLNYYTSGDYVIEKASLESYSEGTAIVKIPYYADADIIDDYLTVTLKYQEDTDSYLVVSWE